VAIATLPVLAADAPELFDRLVKGPGLVGVIPSFVLGGVTLWLVWNSRAALARWTAAGAVAAIRFLQGFRANRITAFLNPSEHTSGAGYQLLQSQIGLASGGLFGSGPGYSRAKWGFLPEAHTDFIAAVIGEEFGLLGTLFLVALIATFLGAGFAISMRAASLFGRLVAIGITVWIGVQALINIGVTAGLLPTKGITLPFISYGGSSMMLSLIGVGVQVAVASDR
jgi:cell division protein FtsW